MLMSPIFDSTINHAIDQLIDQQQLPLAYRDLVDGYLVELSHCLSTKQCAKSAPLIVGVNGGQGSGKSTLCQFLKLLLEKHCNKRCVILSIDDFYLSRADRKQLAGEHHPLLQTRGVPGTHDIGLAIDTITKLQQYKPVSLPGFDKSDDDVIASVHWQEISGQVDIILLEGWCVGAVPQIEEALHQPINDLEKNEDVDGLWRHYVNKKLGNEYQRLFEKIDFLVMLKVPSMSSVYEWRNLQEKKLAVTADGNQIMTEEQIQRFVDHYERLTCHILQEMPSRADVVFELTKSHGIERSTWLESMSISDGK